MDEENKELKFIINADDLGICVERDTAIFDLFEKGLISSASILVNGINFKNAFTRRASACCW